jgi:hypothetical protein
VDEVCHVIQQSRRLKSFLHSTSWVQKLTDRVSLVTRNLKSLNAADSSPKQKRTSGEINPAVTLLHPGETCIPLTE